MMAEDTEVEKAVLDTIEADFIRKGYTVIRDPDGSELPEFLRNYRPDAIAIGKNPKYVIEIIRGQHDRFVKGMKSLQKFFDDSPEWKLTVQYVPKPDPLDTPDRVSIERAIQQAEKVAGIEKKAAFMLLWSALEAVARRLEPEIADKPVSAVGLANLFVSQGYATQEDGKRLRELGKLRNEIAHGALYREPTSEELKTLHGFCDRFLSHDGTDPIAAE